MVLSQLILRFVVFIVVATAPLALQTGSCYAAEKSDVSEAGSALNVGELEEKANQYYWSGKIKEAQKLCKSIVEKGACLERNPAPECARKLLNLGLCHVKLQEFDQAKKFLKKALSILEDNGEGQSLAAADCSGALAECVYNDGNFPKAAKFYERALAILDEELGTWHQDSLYTLEGLGGSYYSADEYEKSLPHYRRIAQIDLLAYGPDHARVGLSLNNLSDVYHKLKDYDAAKPLFEQAVWIFRKTRSHDYLKQFKTSDVGDQYSPEELKTIKKRIVDVVMGSEIPPEIALVSFELLKSPGFDPYINRRY